MAPVGSIFLTNPLTMSCRLILQQPHDQRSLSPLTAWTLITVSCYISLPTASYFHIPPTVLLLSITQEYLALQAKVILVDSHRIPREPGRARVGSSARFNGMHRGSVLGLTGFSMLELFGYSYTMLD
jgi:hypothetical protein